MPMEGCLWPLNFIERSGSDPLNGVKKRWATYTPERLAARAMLLFFGCSAMSFVITWGVAGTGIGFIFNIDKGIGSDQMHGWLLVLWLLRMLSLFAVVQLIWAGLRLIADAIRSTRRAGDDRPAWPPASKP